MSKIIGGIFTVIGFILFAVITMLYMNSSAYFDYTNNATAPTYVDLSKHLSFFETGLGAPSVITFLLLAIGLTFLFVSKEPRLK